MVDGAPTSLSYATNPAVYTKGVAIAPNSPTVGGGTATAFSVSPALPAGLTLNTHDRRGQSAPPAATAAQGLLHGDRQQPQRQAPAWAW